MSKIDGRPWLLLAVFSLVGFQINAATFASLGVVLPSMVRDLKMNWTQAGFGFTTLGVAVGSSSLLPALLIRRFGVRVTLLVGTSVVFAGFASLAATHGVAAYVLGAALCGVGYQMMALIPATHVLAAVFRERALPLGVYFTSNSLGGVAGPWLVYAVMHTSHGHWRAFWQLQMAASLALGAICAVMVGGPALLARMAARIDIDLAEDLTKPNRARVYRTAADWTVRGALRTPQFFILAAAYFGHLLVGVAVAGLSVGHLTERGVTATMAGAMLSLEALVQTGGRAVAGLVGDRLDPRLLLIFALGSLAVGAAALSIANTLPLMLVYAVGSGLGFGLTGLAVTILLLNYFGRRHNLEIFSLTCLVGAVSALGATLGGRLRDLTGAFGSTFQIYAALIAIIFLAGIFLRPPIPKTNRTGETQALSGPGGGFESAA